MPIIFREDVGRDQVSDQHHDASTPQWQHDYSTHTASLIARSNQRLLVYFSEVNAFENTARSQESSDRLPSIQKENQSILHGASNGTLQSTTVYRPPHQNPQTYRGVRANHTSIPRSVRAPGDVLTSDNMLNYPSTRRKRNSDRSTDPIPTNSLSDPSQQIDRERKDSQLLPRKTYVPPQIPAQRQSELRGQSPSHASELAVPPAAVISSKSERPAYDFPRVAVVGSGIIADPGSHLELYNNRLQAKPDRSPFGDEYEIRFGKPQPDGNGGSHLKLEGDILSPKSLNMNPQQHGIDKREVAELPTDSRHSTGVTQNISGDVVEKFVEKPFRNMTTSTFEPTPSEEKRFRTDDQSAPRFNFWRKPWMLIAFAITLVIVLAGLAVGLFFVIKNRNK